MASPYSKFFVCFADVLIIKEELDLQGHLSFTKTGVPLGRHTLSPPPHKIHECSWDVSSQYDGHFC